MLISHELIRGIKLFNPTRFDDSRGSLFSIDLADEFLKAGKCRYVESVSNCNVIRGIHIAKIRENQNKLIWCSHGRILDIQIDLRTSSSTFLCHSQIILDSKDGNFLLLQPGIGHAFLTLEDATKVSYFINTPFLPASEISMNIFSPIFNINLPIDFNPIVSEKDSRTISKTELMKTIEEINL